LVEALLYSFPISPFSVLELGFLLSPSGSREAWAKSYVLSLQPMLTVKRKGNVLMAAQYSR
jgi:hypothetical protein